MLLSLTIAFARDTIIEIALFFIISGVYFSYLESSKIQASIGKKLLDLRVVPS
ncbi:RDD family protein [Rickettsia endosymbiont of Nabis limbatus]|uniref:RDD family protein n=1 Tax=Rickettsia endosymbiont of Nabis limbatus TaxID=3066268 RepID=UPI003AF34579